MAPKKTPVAAPATAAPAAAEAAPAKVVKKTLAPKAAPAPAPVAEPEPVAETPVDATEEAVEDDTLVQMATKLSSLQATLKELSALFKIQQKAYQKLVKQAKKVENKRSQAKKSPSGFAKPSLLVDSLCDFLKVPHGTKMARTEVTRHITEYVKSNNLLNPENKRIMNLDGTLKKLMVVPEGAEVTFFNLQKYIKHLFVKEETA